MEVEIKARISNPEPWREKLHKLCRYEGFRIKNDSYYGLSGTNPDSSEMFRLRQSGGKAVVTTKDKSVIHGAEINDEKEFSVSDPAAFDSFVRRLGYEPLFQKEKRSELFTRGDMNIELCEIRGLGFFIEVEQITAGDAPSVIEQARKMVSSFLLEELEVDAGAVEERFYLSLMSRKME